MTTPASTTRLDQDKAKTAILHIAKKMEDCPGFGSVVLNKVLFYADHLYYRDSGEKITGFRYVRQLRGPTPSPEEFMPIKEDLILNHRAEEIQRDYFGKNQKRLVVKSTYDLSVLSTNELSAIDSAILMFRQSNGYSASQLSHEQELGWQLADHMEEIPASTFLLDEDEVNERDIQWAEALLA